MVMSLYWMMIGERVEKLSVSALCIHHKIENIKYSILRVDTG